MSALSKLGNTLSNDQLPAEKFDYMLSNPPFGVDWKKIETDINNEHKLKGADGRFGPGLPRVSDGSLLFLLHLISKLRDAKSGAGGSASFLTVPHYSPAARAAVKARSAATFWKRICWKALSPCLPICFTTPVSLPMFGCCLTKKRQNAKAKSSLSTAATCAARCVNRWGQNAYSRRRGYWFNHPHVWRFRTRCHHYACGVRPGESTRTKIQPGTPARNNQNRGGKNFCQQSLSQHRVWLSSHHR